MFKDLARAVVLEPSLESPKLISLNTPRKSWIASASLGYAIAPNDTWATLNAKINDSEIIPSDYQTIFDNFNKNAELNAEAIQDFP